MAADRLFFAVVPPAGAAVQVAALIRQLRAIHGLPAKTVSLAKLHVTVCHLGAFDGVSDALLSELRAAAARVRSNAFALAFDTMQTFRPSSRTQRPLPTVLTASADVAGLTSLHTQLARLLIATATVQASPNYLPHLTLWYDRAAIDTQPVPPLAWTVHEFVLLHSRIGTGLPYEELGRWPLAA